MKVLVAAYACNPYKGSEEGVGWGWVQALSKQHRLWVLTAQYHRTTLETAKKKCPERFKNLHFIYVPHQLWHYQPSPGWRFIERSVFKPFMHVAYRLWQHDAFDVAKNLQQKIAFDLVHQITYVGFRFPGHLWKLNIPFVWGPIGGLENVSWRFLSAMNATGRVYYTGRNMINDFDKKFLTGPKKAFKAARGGIIAATSGIQQEIHRWYGENSTVVCEIGPPPEIAHNHFVREPDGLLKLSWSGEHLPGKALPLLLQALFELPSNITWQLDILGQGPCSARWQRLARKLGVDGGCKWYGQVDRAKAVRIIHRTHIFIITSLKDLTSTVLLEALSQGVPVICPNHSGFADVVTGGCGIKIAMRKPQQFATDLADAITLLANDEEYRRKLARGALRRIKDFSWEAKARQMDLIYQRVTN